MKILPNIIYSFTSIVYLYSLSEFLYSIKKKEKNAWRRRGKKYVIISLFAHFLFPK
jgi:hypothetical protein